MAVVAVLMIVLMLGGAPHGYAAPPKGQRYLVTGGKLMTGGNMETGFRMIAVAAALEPANPAPQSVLLTLLNQRCFDHDVALFEQLAEILPDFPALLECLGRRYEGARRYADAENVYLRWAGRDSGLREPYARLGELYKFTGRPREALSAFSGYRDRSAGESDYALRRMAAIIVESRIMPKTEAGGSEAGNGLSNGFSLDALRKAARDGDREARYQLAEYYRTGQGGGTDLWQAAEWYEMAAGQGHPRAQLMLGRLYQSGWGGQQPREKEGFAWIQRAARQGLQEAQFEVALALLTGNGTTANVGQAMRWCETAARGGMPEAMHVLGSLYAYGIGAPKNHRMAMYWLDSAVEDFIADGRPQAAREVRYAIRLLAPEQQLGGKLENWAGEWVATLAMR